MEITPYLTTFDVPLGRGNIDNPEARVIVVAEISAFQFRKHAVLAGYFKFKYPHDGKLKEYDGKLWWEDGMQNEIAQTIYILTDDIESGIFCGYCVQNDPKYFLLLGKLKENDFTKKVKEVFQKYFDEIGK